MKNKVTLSVRKDYIIGGKEISKIRQSSFSQYVSEKIKEKVDVEKRAKKEALNFLKNLVPQKRNENVDWKKEAKEWAIEKHG